MRKNFWSELYRKESSANVVHSSSPTNRPIPSQSLNSDLFGKIIKIALLLSITLCGMEFVFDQLGSAVLAVPLPTSCHPQPTPWWGGVRNREDIHV